jgi:hypothetical protein
VTSNPRRRFRVAGTEHLGDDGFFVSPLAPIVKHVVSGGAIAGLVRSVHRHTLDHCAEATRYHLAVRLLAREIDSGQYIRHAGVAREHGANVEQPTKALPGAGPRPHRGELYKAAALPASLAGPQ